MSGICLGAYVLGCFTTGYYLVRLRAGQDIRVLGSGNVGARNVGRVFGWPAFGVTLVGDFAKGALAVWVVEHFTNDERLIALAMLAVVIGHVWPIQLRFRGGKGIATSSAALLVWDYHLAVGLGLLFFAAYAALRRTVSAGLLAFALLPVLSLYLDRDGSVVRPISVTILTALVLFAHRKNLLQEISEPATRREMLANEDQSEL